MNDATLRARLQDLREGHTGEPHRGADAFVEDARWRDNADAPWIEGRDAIAEHLAEVGGGDARWDPSEVVVEGRTALVRCRFVPAGDAAAREGWVRLSLGDDRLVSWDAVWAEVG